MTELFSWVHTHPWTALSVLYAVLSVVNGVLDVAAPQSTTAKVVHVLLDRLSPFTRNNAIGTFKLPGAASKAIETLSEQAGKLADR